MQFLKYWLESGKWGLYESTPQRKALKAGDPVLFYAATKGVVAFATVAGSANVLTMPEEWPEPVPQDRTGYKLPVTDISWFKVPLALDSKLRSELEAFHGRDPGAAWSWLVQTTMQLVKSDFERLTKGQGS